MPQALTLTSNRGRFGLAGFRIPPPLFFAKWPKRAKISNAGAKWKKKNFDGMGVFITANVNRQSPHAELAAGARDELWSPQTISLISMALDIQAYINTFPRRM